MTDDLLARIDAAHRSVDFVQESTGIRLTAWQQDTLAAMLLGRESQIAASFRRTVGGLSRVLANAPESMSRLSQALATLVVVDETWAFEAAKNARRKRAHQMYRQRRLARSRRNR